MKFLVILSICFIIGEAAELRENNDAPKNLDKRSVSPLRRRQRRQYYYNPCQYQQSSSTFNQDYYSYFQNTDPIYNNPFPIQTGAGGPCGGVDPGLCTYGQYYCGRQLRKMGYTNTRDNALYECDQKSDGLYRISCGNGCQDQTTGSYCKCTTGATFCGYELRLRNIYPQGYVNDHTLYRCDDGHTLSAVQNCWKCYANNTHHNSQCTYTYYGAAWCQSGRKYCGFELVALKYQGANYHTLYECSNMGYVNAVEACESGCTQGNGRHSHCAKNLVAHKPPPSDGVGDIWNEEGYRRTLPPTRPRPSPTTTTRRPRPTRPPFRTPIIWQPVTARFTAATHRITEPAPVFTLPPIPIPTVQIQVIPGENQVQMNTSHVVHPAIDITVLQNQSAGVSLEGNGGASISGNIDGSMLGISVGGGGSSGHISGSMGGGHGSGTNFTIIQGGGSDTGLSLGMGGGHGSSGAVIKVEGGGSGSMGGHGSISTGGSMGGHGLSGSIGGGHSGGHGIKVITGGTMGGGHSGGGLTGGISMGGGGSMGGHGSSGSGLQVSMGGGHGSGHGVKVITGGSMGGGHSGGGLTGGISMGGGGSMGGHGSGGSGLSGSMSGGHGIKVITGGTMSGGHSGGMSGGGSMGGHSSGGFSAGGSMGGGHSHGGGGAIRTGGSVSGGGSHGSGLSLSGSLGGSGASIKVGGGGSGLGVKLG